MLDREVFIISWIEHLNEFLWFKHLLAILGYRSTLSMVIPEGKVTILSENISNFSFHVLSSSLRSTRF